MLNVFTLTSATTSISSASVSPCSARRGELLVGDIAAVIDHRAGEPQQRSAARFTGRADTAAPQFGLAQAGRTAGVRVGREAVATFVPLGRQDGDPLPLGP